MVDGVGRKPGQVSLTSSEPKLPEWIRLDSELWDKNHLPRAQNGNDSLLEMKDLWLQT